MVTPSINKNLGIQQRIPLSVLGAAFDDFVGQGVAPERIEELLKEFYSGANRIVKARRQICACLSRSRLTPWLESHRDSLAAAAASDIDRRLILSAVICARYSFCYDIAVIFARQFRIRDEISSELLDNLIGQKYGYNASTRNSRNCAVPQLIEAGLVGRVKPSVFKSAAPLEPKHAVTRQIWEECYFINEPLASREDVADLPFEPFFRYLHL